MRRSLVELVRWLEDRPWNRPGTDKTWVLKAMSQHSRFMREARQATRVSARIATEDDER